MEPAALLIALSVVAVVALIVLCPSPLTRKQAPGTQSSPKRWSPLLRGCLIFLVLFVVAIVLVAIAPGPSIIRAAKLMKTSNMVAQIDTAFLSYTTEYDVPPPSKDPAGFIKNLMGDNPRHIDFLNLKPQDMNAQGEVLDAWGTPLRITLIDPQHPEITSAGQDKIWQTPDDLPGEDLPVANEDGK